MAQRMTNQQRRPAAWAAGVLTSFTLVAATGCAGSSEEAAAYPPEFRAALPSAPALSKSAIDALKRELGLDNGNPPAQLLSAAAFGEYDAKPRVRDAEWKTFVSIYRDVRDVALANHWSVRVEGFTQARDPIGTPDPLSQERAEAAEVALVAMGYPANRVSAVGRGVGGPAATDRRVTISFVKE